MPISMKAQVERKRWASSIASASAATRWRAVELAGQGIVARQLHELLVAGVALIVDADDALHARRLAVGTGEPAAGLLDPEYRRRGRGAHAIFDPIRRAVAAMDRRRKRQRLGPDRALRLDQPGKFRLRSPAPPPGYRGIPRRAWSLQPIASVAMIPDKGGLAEGGQDGRGLRQMTAVTFASFRDTADGDSPAVRIEPVRPNP